MIMHDQNELPSMEHGKSQQIKANNMYLLRYSLIRIIRLREGYDTKCGDYGEDEKFVIRSDCIRQCYQKHHDELCNESGIAFSTLLLRKEIVKEKRNEHVSFCEQYDDLQSSLMSICSKQCPNECDITYYPSSLNNIRQLNDSTNLIFIQHNEMPDIIIVHIPEMNWISFVCNFGGLLGMWLGVSFLSIIDRIKTLFIRFLNKKRRPIKIQVNNFNINSLNRSLST